MTERGGREEDVIGPQPPFEPEPPEREDPLRRQPLSPIPGHEREPESEPLEPGGDDAA